MVPGFVRLGAVVILCNVLLVVAFYGYVRYRFPVSDRTARTRALWGVGGGTGLAVLGQFAAIGAPGYVWMADGLSFDQASAIVDAGVLATLVGYGVVCVGLALHLRASDRRR